MEVEVSLLIRTKNEGRHLAETLKAVLSQSLKDCEFIILDSGSTDNTREIALSFSQTRLLEIEPERFTFGLALNLAARHARGKYLVMLSAHALPADGQWLSSLIRHFEDSRVAAVYGRQLPRPEAWPPVKVDLLHCYGPNSQVHANVEDTFFSNANGAIRKALWERIPFDEALPACEDQDWARRAVAAGYLVVYDPQAAVYHSHNEVPWRVYRRYRDEEKGWQRILPGRKVDFHSFFRTWKERTLMDLRFILKNREDWLWLLLSPGYRIFWAFGQWRPYL
ncbi:MAG: glycosyltransferase family 2 protein [Anaerolineae bacterium]